MSGVEVFGLGFSIWFCCYQSELWLSTAVSSSTPKLAGVKLRTVSSSIITAIRVPLLFNPHWKRESTMKNISAASGFSWSYESALHSDNWNLNLVHLFEMTTGNQVILQVCSFQYALSFSSSVAKCTAITLQEMFGSLPVIVWACVQRALLASFLNLFSTLKYRDWKKSWIVYCIYKCESMTC